MPLRIWRQYIARGSLSMSVLTSWRRGSGCRIAQVGFRISMCSAPMWKSEASVVLESPVSHSSWMRVM